MAAVIQTKLKLQEIHQEVTINAWTLGTRLLKKDAQLLQVVGKVRVWLQQF